jgi:hypothetical protein
MPAAHVTAAAARKTRSTSGVASKTAAVLGIEFVATVTAERPRAHPPNG